ncbi:hypothetical protein [Agrobacterium tumefaciens]|uniref:hypothetical protein n=1 Tax=Agrobacterium tumefaciens TaxID=358 RepID=UPI00157220C5|nr:hypothetical protein [Agrobacterium tumefaciens]NTD88664.1 hypothetical protein [Agrobacterium tumefaciens]NTD91393.1 hypothetical protein [Agrobacterium tumefaciens]NTD98841.1 hypothetical protein [Agrobacterium tumefaciens]NTE12221.1 hypothetical protein [Agrobacterium tumefaciens]NTE20299.1 hypothetical protein [Agrobacterium tumefaciens]
MLIATFISDVPPTKPDAKIKVDVSKDEDGNLLMIVEQALTKEQKDTLYQAMRLFKGGDFSGPGFNVYLKGEDIVLEHVNKGLVVKDVPRSEQVHKHVKAIIREMIQSGELTR